MVFKIFITAFCLMVSAFALEGQVQAGLAPMVGSTVTLWSAGDSAPQRMGQATTDSHGRFSINASSTAAEGRVYYLLAQGGRSVHDHNRSENHNAVLLALVGSRLPSYVVVNELSTVATIWTAARFIHGASLRGNALGLHVAAVNVPNFVDLQAGKLAAVIQNSANGMQTTTLSRFCTLANLMTACITRITPSACDQLYQSATFQGSKRPGSTLEVFHAIAMHPWENTESIFKLLDRFFPVPKGQTFRHVPFLPYLNYPPKDWSLALRFTGGGLDAAGAISIDHYGNVWVTNNFLSGSQSGLQPNLLGGGISKLAPNGYPISPPTTGYRGGGIDGPGFGQAIDHRGNVWVGSVHGKCISVFDGRSGQPLSPPEGYTLNGRLGKIQGIIATHRGDIWALDNSNNHLIKIPNGDISKAQIFCEQTGCNLKTPFDLAIDQHERIYVSNGNAHWVTRFNANNPSQFEQITTGYEGKGIAVDSLGNVWQSNFSSQPEKQSKDILEVYAKQLEEQLKGQNTGAIAMVTPDGKVTSFSSKDIVGPWGIAVDGDDHIWVADFTGRAVTKLCGMQKTTAQGHNPGDVIAQFLGGGLQHLTDVVIDQAGNVWVANNWDHMASCLAKKPNDIDSTRCGGNGVVVYYGIAAPVRVPQFGPPLKP